MCRVKGEFLMRQQSIKLKTAQFARLHEINKRTLHFYDKIGIFSPKYKGENNYRYYDYMQSFDLENILMLKELNMSLEEIKQYLANPNSCQFMEIADRKIEEIDREMQRMKRTREILQRKQQQLEECQTAKDGEIRVVFCEEQYLLTNSFPFDDASGIEQILNHMRQAGGLEQYRMGCGSFISMEKVIRKKFVEYDGIYTPLRKKIKSSNLTICPKGQYLFSYVTGNWDKIQFQYENILKYASERKLKLIGNAYEIGLNEFAISSEDDYVTKIMIQIG